MSYYSYITTVKKSMNKIKQLSISEAQKIAAGEVVERPANVIKELIENSLDAGATQISIFVHDAGKSMIRVIDNGCGMSPDDAQECFKHHATSKITTVDQLQSLATFGFRGEALSSISSVSKITLITKEPHAPCATKISLTGGTVTDAETVTAPDGTDITVSDLFYSVPARKKFLKTNDTEWRHIILLFQAFCLSYTAVHFKLYTNGTLHFNCPAVIAIHQRVNQLWDHQSAAQMLPIKTSAKECAVQGFISNHTFSRFDRSGMFFFVNNRWVKNHGLAKAIIKGYTNVLPAQKFPLVSLAIQIDPSCIDVNIHPRKEEIQFLNPRLIEHLVSSLVKEALELHLSNQLKKPVYLSSTISEEPRVDFTPSARIAHLQEMVKPRPQSAYGISLDTGPNLASSNLDAIPSSAPQNHQTHSYQEQLTTASVSEIPAQEHFTIVGQLHKTYILIEQPEGLFIVDQHAAHERILYELFSQRFEEVAPIQLLFPIIVTITESDAALIETYQEIFTRNNIIIEIFGQQQIIVQAIPSYLKEIDWKELIAELISWIKEENSFNKDFLFKKVNEKLHAQMACKAAVKAGDTLSMSHMQQLIIDLAKTPNRFTCPHGRPTGWSIKTYEIEKKFKRVG